MKDYGLYGVLKRSAIARNDRHGTVYVREVTEGLLKKVKICRKDEFMFLLDRRTAISTVAFPSMTTDYTKAYYVYVMKALMGSQNGESVWTRKNYRDAESFVGFVKLFSDRTAPMLESTKLLAISTNAILLNF